MKSLTIGISIIVASLLVPATASGITFGEWATTQGYSPGAVMPGVVSAGNSSIDSLSGLSDFDWSSTWRLWLIDNQLTSIEVGALNGLTHLRELFLSRNELSNIDSGAFNGMTNLKRLHLDNNQLSSIEEDAFSGLANLQYLILTNNQLTSIEAGEFSGLTNLQLLVLRYNQVSSLESDAFSGLTNLTSLTLDNNQLSSIEAGDFSALTNLTHLNLYGNQLSSIEAGTFSGLPNLESLNIGGNQLSSIEANAFGGIARLRALYVGRNPGLIEFNLDDADFSSLADFDVQGNVNIICVSISNTVINQASLAVLMDGDTPYNERIGIGELDGVTELDLSGIDFANITDLTPLYEMDDLTDLWLVGTRNLDAFSLDALLDELATIEGTDVEGILYMTQADFNAFNTAGGNFLAAWHAEPGHHVAFVPEPVTWMLLAVFVLAMMCHYRMVRT